MAATQHAITTFLPRRRFSDWPNGDIPAVAAGVYVIWESETLIYCGMSGRQLDNATDKSRYGLVTRFQSHASGRLSGDQFCAYVAKASQDVLCRSPRPPVGEKESEAHDGDDQGDGVIRHSDRLSMVIDRRVVTPTGIRRLGVNRSP